MGLIFFGIFFVRNVEKIILIKKDSLFGKSNVKRVFTKILFFFSFFALFFSCPLHKNVPKKVDPMCVPLFVLLDKMRPNC